MTTVAYEKLDQKNCHWGIQNMYFRRLKNSILMFSSLDKPDIFTIHFQPSPAVSGFLVMFLNFFSYQLPTGEALTVVLIGKTGNGKSAAGVQIIGQKSFEVSDGAQSETKSCQKAGRKDERDILVIDTPGIIDTSSVKKMTGTWKYWPGYREDQKKILTELAKMFVYASRGINAFLLTVKFGTRFTPEDSQALLLLRKFLGEEALDYMILLLTHGDQAERNARADGKPVDQYVKQWVDKMEEWVKTFVQDELKDRVVLMNATLDINEQPEAYKKQLRKIIEVIREE